MRIFINSVDSGRTSICFTRLSTRKPLEADIPCITFHRDRGRALTVSILLRVSRHYIAIRKLKI